MHASFLTDNRRLAAAIDCLAEAAKVIQDDWRCPPVLATEISIKYSIALGLTHRDEAALAVLHGCGSRWRGSIPHRLEFALIHRQAEQHTWCGDPRTARQLLPQVRVLCQQGGGALDLQRVNWLEGRIVAAEGDLPVALKILSATQEQFLKEDAIHEAALLALEIAAVLHALGRLEETEMHARQAVVLFLPLGLDEETLCALSLLADAACRRCLTPKLIDALLRYARGGEIPESALWI
jgi:hypothetical protein